MMRREMMKTTFLFHLLLQLLVCNKIQIARQTNKISLKRSRFSVKGEASFFFFFFFFSFFVKALLLIGNVNFHKYNVRKVRHTYAAPLF